MRKRRVSSMFVVSELFVLAWVRGSWHSMTRKRPALLVILTFSDVSQMFMVLDDFFTFVFFVELVCNLFANWFRPFFTDGTIRVVSSSFYWMRNSPTTVSNLWRPTSS